jgi:hypothetical protein
MFVLSSNNEVIIHTQHINYIIMVHQPQTRGSSGGRWSFWSLQDSIWKIPRATQPSSDSNIRVYVLGWLWQSIRIWVV